VFRADLINPAFLLHTFAGPQICYVIAVVIIIIIIIIIVVVIVIIMKGEYIPGYSSLWRINFVSLCLVFMDRQYGTCSCHLFNA